MFLALFCWIERLLYWVILFREGTFKISFWTPLTRYIANYCFWILKRFMQRKPIAQAIAFLHSNIPRIVHLDVKPANVLVSVCHSLEKVVEDIFVGRSSAGAHLHNTSFWGNFLHTLQFELSGGLMKVNSDNLHGPALRPISHTCSCTLKQCTSYNNLERFCPLLTWGLGILQSTCLHARRYARTGK